MAQNNPNAGESARDVLKALGLLVGIFVLAFGIDPALVWGALNVGLGVGESFGGVYLVWLMLIALPLTVVLLVAVTKEDTPGRPRRPLWRL